MPSGEIAAPEGGSVSSPPARRSMRSSTASGPSSASVGIRRCATMRLSGLIKPRAVLVPPRSMPTTQSLILVISRTLRQQFRAHARQDNVFLFGQTADAYRPDNLPLALNRDATAPG